MFCGIEKIDIFLGNHMQHNHTEEKVRNGEEYAFVNRDEWKNIIYGA